MTSQDILKALHAELQFLNDGGYQGIAWRPFAVFEESPLCINPLRTNRPAACQKCFLLAFVPPEKRSEQIPCRHIPLNDHGLTPRELPEWGTRSQIEGAMREWLTRAIEDLEARMTASA